MIIFITLMYGGSTGNNDKSFN